MSGQGDAANGTVREGGGDPAEPVLKRRRLLDAGGPIENDETAWQKLRDAKDEEKGYSLTGFYPEDISKAILANPIHIGFITPMGYFVRKGDLPMMRWLYVHGFDTRDAEIVFHFPMYEAAREGNLEACQWLYHHGAHDQIKRRTHNNVSPLSATFYEAEKRDVSRWLILRGALCKDDGSGDLDLGLVKKDLNQYEYCVEERRVLLEWANGHQQDRGAFFVFLMGTLSPPEYSPSALRKLLLQRLLSEQATAQILGLLPTDQNRQLWDNIVGKMHRSCPVNRLVGASGVLQLIADYVGIVRGREARIIRQLTEILSDFNVRLDRLHE